MNAATVRCAGLTWTGSGPELEWTRAPATRLRLGAELALLMGADRCCVGVWRAGRRLACPVRAGLRPETRGGLCPECQLMDKSSSVASDTRMDDPREFAVYLAHHGSAVKVGITAAERGRNRLLEQGALSSALIAKGTLASARRMENLLMNALGLVDRMSTARKRLTRATPSGASERESQLLDLATRAHDLPWPPGQQPLKPEVVDHTPQYGLPPEGLRPTAAVHYLLPERGVVGSITCNIGRDLYLTTERGLLLLDTHLLAGWPVMPSAAVRLDVPLTLIEATQDALF